MSDELTHPELVLEHISLAFQGVKAVTDISFSVRRGEICSVIGPNGAGKSSLLNVVNGVYRPDQGTITFDGELCRRIEPRWAAKRGIARTFQNIALFKRMTVLENVLTGLTLTTRSTLWEQAFQIGRARGEARVQRDRTEKVLSELGIDHLRDVAVGKLSYGLQKRVELARALVSAPRLLLLDEPLAGMSFEEKREMADLIVDVNRERATTVVLIEHDMSVVMDISHHVVVLDYGRKIADGTPEQVRSDPSVIDAYLGTEHAEEVGAAA